MTQAVIFDLDGTLIDSLPDVMNALNSVLADNNRRPVTRDEAKLMVGGGAEPQVGAHEDGPRCSDGWEACEARQASFSLIFKSC